MAIGSALETSQRNTFSENVALPISIPGLTRDILSHGDLIATVRPYVQIIGRIYGPHWQDPRYKLYCLREGGFSFPAYEEYISETLTRANGLTKIITNEAPSLAYEADISTLSQQFLMYGACLNGYKTTSNSIRGFVANLSDNGPENEPDVLENIFKFSLKPHDKALNYSPYEIVKTGISKLNPALIKALSIYWGLIPSEGGVEQTGREMLNIDRHLLFDYATEAKEAIERLVMQGRIEKFPPNRRSVKDVLSELISLEVPRTGADRILFGANRIEIAQQFAATNPEGADISPLCKSVIRFLGEQLANNRFPTMGEISANLEITMGDVNNAVARILALKNARESGGTLALNTTSGQIRPNGNRDRLIKWGQTNPEALFTLLNTLDPNSREAFELLVKQNEAGYYLDIEQITAQWQLTHPENKSGFMADYWAKKLWGMVPQEWRSQQLSSMQSASPEVFSTEKSINISPKQPIEQDIAVIPEKVRVMNKRLLQMMGVGKAIISPKLVNREREVGFWREIVPKRIIEQYPNERDLYDCGIAILPDGLLVDRLIVEAVGWLLSNYSEKDLALNLCAEQEAIDVRIDIIHHLFERCKLKGIKYTELVTTYEKMIIRQPLQGLTGKDEKLQIYSTKESLVI